MRRGVVIGGVVLVVIGLLMVTGGYLLASASANAVIPAGSELSISPSGATGGTFSGSWSNATSGTTVYIVTGTASCVSPTGVVAKSGGASGSISASLSVGTTYQIYACALGSPSAVTLTYTYIGLSWLMVIGIVLAVIGIILIVMGARVRRPDAAKAASPPTIESP
jgi:uncharacterized membrane protein